MYQMDHDQHNHQGKLMCDLMMVWDINSESSINHGIDHEYHQLSLQVGVYVKCSASSILFFGNDKLSL